MSARNPATGRWVVVKTLDDAHIHWEPWPGKARREAACQWFATKWRTRASEIGVQSAARLMRKQGVPCDVAVSILATR